MNLRRDGRRVGAGMLSSGAALVALGPVPVAFWVGFAFLVCGPMLLMLEPKQRRRKSRAKATKPPDHEEK